MKRRSFISKTFAGSVGAVVIPKIVSAKESASLSKVNSALKGPISICTWHFSEANAAAAKALESGSYALTAAI